MCSTSIPPKTMPPSRPFPTGNASTHRAAGCRYQSASEDEDRTASLSAQPAGVTSVSWSAKSQAVDRQVLIVYTQSSGWRTGKFRIASSSLGSGLSLFQSERYCGAEYANPAKSKLG